MQAGKIRIIDKRLVVTCLPHVSIKLRRVFAGAQRQKAGIFSLAATPAHAYELEWFRQLHPLDIDEQCEVRFRALVSAHKRRIAAIAETEKPNYEPRTFELAIPPRVYQREAADLALRTSNLLIADDLGVGKTVSALCTLAVSSSLPAVVVTMTHLPRQWCAEIQRFLPQLSVHIPKTGKPDGFGSKKLKVMAYGKQSRTRKPDVIIVGYSKLDGWADTLASYARTIIFDEIQELRIPGSDKYKAAAAIAADCELRIGLSATPIYNYGGEIWSVLNAIAPLALGTYEEFKAEWCSGGTSDGGDGNWMRSNKVCVSDPAALGTYLREHGLMIRRTRRDVGRELPDLTVVRHVVDFNPARINETAVEIAELAKRVLERTGTNFERMRWSGEIDWRMREGTGIGKAAGVADFVRLLVDGGERVLLGGWHHAVYAIWRGLFEQHGITFAMYTGEETDSEKAEAVRRFIAGEVQILIMSVRSGAGLDGLQKVCRTVVVGELDWSPQVIRQFIGRSHRDGQAEPVTAYYMVAEEGSDPVIEDVLGVKDAQSQGIRDPDQVGAPQLVGAADDHMKRLMEDVLRRYSGKSAAPADATDEAMEAAS